jgi:predicted small secreted protein
MQLTYNINYRSLKILCGIALSLSLYGCNTMEGVGTDIKEAGEALEHSAEQNKPEPTQYCPYCLQPLKERRKP